VFKYRKLQCAILMEKTQISWGVVIDIKHVMFSDQWDLKRFTNIYKT